MTDIQKQTKLATKEQLRLAELLLQPGRNLLSTIDDAASQKRLKKVIELTNCTASVAEVALIDSEGSVEAAVALLLDKPDELVLWSHQGSKIRNRPSKALAGNTGTGSTTGQQKQQSKSAVMTSYGGSGRRGDSQRGENRFRRDVQNTSDGKQGLSGEGQQKKVFSNRSGEQQKNGYSNRAKSHERFGEKPFKPRGDRTTASGAANNGFRRRNNNPNASNNAFSKNENIAPNGTWNETKDWNANDNNCGQWNNNVAVEKEKDTNFGIGTFNDGEEAHPDEWKTGPKEYVQSTLQSANIINNSTTAQTPAVNTSSWPSLEHNNSTLTIGGTTGNATNIDIEQPPKPKTFASVAASKKAQQPPPQQPPQQMLVRKQFSDINALSDASGESSQTKQQQYNRQSFKQQTAETDSILLETKPVNGNCENTSVEQKWSTSVDWGVPPISPRLGNGQTAVISNQNTLPQHSESTSATVMAPADSFGPSAAHSMSVNQEYTNQLKSAIGLMQQPQNEHNNQQHSPQNNQQQLLISQNNNINQTKRMSTASSVEFFQQQISQMHDTLAADASDFDKKVEFATGDLPPPTVANIASSYQFGFQFDTKNGLPPAASLNGGWPTKHISSVEMDRSMLKDSTAANVLSTMTSIPTTSSNITAQFSTSIHAPAQHPSQNDYRSQQQQQQLLQRNQLNVGNVVGSAALSFTDTASVNYPPVNFPQVSYHPANNSNIGLTNNVASSASHPPTATSLVSSSTNSSVSQSQQQQVGKTTMAYYTAANQSQQQQMHPSMMAAAAAAAAATVQQQQTSAAATQMSQQLTQHHLQQHQPPPQAIYHHHQTSTAPPPAASAVSQFPSYNMPYMYSPVAAAQTLPGAEIDRFLLQQYGPYRGLDMQMGAMTLGPPTTLAPASHRNQLDSYMDNKFGPQQQAANQQGQFSNNPVTAAQQQRAGPPVQADAAVAAAAIFGGGHVAPPPGFGMPTPPAQASYMPQPANLQSLFQMPTYHPHYQHQFNER